MLHPAESCRTQTARSTPPAFWAVSRLWNIAGVPRTCVGGDRRLGGWLHPRCRLTSTDTGGGDAAAMRRRCGGAALFWSCLWASAGCCLLCSLSALPHFPYRAENCRSTSDKYIHLAAAPLHCWLGCSSVYPHSQRPPSSISLNDHHNLASPNGRPSIPGAHTNSNPVRGFLSLLRDAGPTRSSPERPALPASCPPTRYRRAHSTLCCALTLTLS